MAMAKILLYVFGAATIACALSVIISSVCLLRANLEYKAWEIEKKLSMDHDHEAFAVARDLLDKFEIIPKNMAIELNSSSGTEGNSGGVGTSGIVTNNNGKEFKTGEIKMMTGFLNPAISSDFRIKTTEWSGQPKRGHDHTGHSKEHQVLDSKCYPFHMAISSTGIVLGIFQLLLATVCCFIIVYGGRFPAMMWILANLICLIGIGIMLIMCGRYAECVDGFHEKSWGHLQRSFEVDLTVAIMFILVTTFVLPRIARRQQSV